MKDKISGYTITYNAASAGLPFEESIRNHLKFCDEVVVVDGGSTDGTFRILELIQEEVGSALKIVTSPWNFSYPDIMGRQKTIARQSCSNRLLYQFDTDEFLPDWQFDALRKLVRNFPHVILHDLPIISFYNGMCSVSRKENHFKWRLSQNVPGIIHGVHNEARKQDKDGNLYFNREESDSCEYIWDNNFSFVERTPIVDTRLWNINLQWMDKELPQEHVPQVSKYLAELANGENYPCIYHYGTVDVKRKAAMAHFWSKMKRTYKERAEVTREGKWIDGEVSNESIDQLAKKLALKDTFFVDVKRHPKEIMPFAIRESWNQVGRYNGVEK